MLLFVGIYSLFSKTIGLKDNFKGINKHNISLGIILAFSLGFYDGFFGPGAGSFLIFGLIGIYGFDFINAGGNSKVLNFVSNVTSLVLFAVNGEIYYLYGIPAAIFMIFGARFGAKLALKRRCKTYETGICYNVSGSLCKASLWNGKIITVSAVFKDVKITVFFYRSVKAILLLQFTLY